MMMGIIKATSSSPHDFLLQSYFNVWKAVRFLVLVVSSWVDDYELGESTLSTRLYSFRGFYDSSLWTLYYVSYNLF